MKTRNSAVFIPSYNRPMRNPCVVLRKAGYTGKIFVVCDDSDVTLPMYRQKYGDAVLVFSKAKYDWVDVMDNMPSQIGVVYARCAIQDFAEQYGITHYVMFDDDIFSLKFRVAIDKSLKQIPIKNADAVFDCIWDILDETDIKAISLGQGGDFVGGVDSKNFKRVFSRKALNPFFVRTDRKINFLGRMNEDICAYVTEGIRGKLFYTNYQITVDLAECQEIRGGMSDVYSRYGTYYKSLYPVICAPSCVKLYVPSNLKYLKVHQKVVRANQMPCLLSEKWKKTTEDKK